MSIPLRYNYRNVCVRWRTTLLTAAAAALVVAGLTIMLSFIRGMRNACVTSGEPENVLVLGKGQPDEVMSQLDSRSAAQIEHSSRIRRNSAGRSLASRELFMGIHHVVKETGEYTILSVRGVRPEAWEVHSKVKLIRGSMFRPSQSEVVIGKSVAKGSGFLMGDKIRMGTKDWTIVGIFEASGATLESEIWCDLDELASHFRRVGRCSTLVLRTSDEREAKLLADELNADKQLNVEAQVEVAYYSEQAEQANAISTAGTTIAAVMAVGAVFGIMNTMFAAVGQRIKDIALLRIIGFDRHEILLSFLFESLLITVVGGVIGTLVGYATNGLTHRTALGAKEVEFMFEMDSSVLLAAIGFTVLMGVLGGLLPAISAMRIHPLQAMN